eukprot:TRINITY_DN2774_c0_g1_i12.p1 TRINITY_DN2774_c0_g1~~TRINITY_DN2774_c0_g1_i12.p1  ORF type:complete len:118 (+),score=19.31 TRINITY_DN2774_c0_g1_i12:76-429(+)
MCIRDRKMEVSNSLLHSLCATISKVRGEALYSEVISFLGDRIYKPKEKERTVEIVSNAVLKEFPCTDLKDLVGNYHELDKEFEFAQYSIAEVKECLSKMNLPHASYLLFDVSFMPNL